MKISNLGQEPPASSKALNEDLMDMDILCTFRIKIEKEILEHGYIKKQNQNQGQDAKTQSGTSSVLQSPKSGLKGHGCSLYLQNHDKELKFRTCVYQKTSDHIKIEMKIQSPVENVQHPPKP